MRCTATRSSTRNGDSFLVDHHTLTPLELERRFNTSLDQGLDTSSAATRLFCNGPNRITRTKPSRIGKAISFLVGGFTKQLWICFILAILSYRPLGSLNGATPDPTNIGLAGVVLFLIIVEVSINLYHERTTQAAFQAFETIISTRNLVLRSGAKQWVKNEELVVGDVVDLRHGGMVPADMRIFAADCLRLDTSALDGTPKPKTCTLDSTSDIYMESHNVALFGSFVVGGCGRGVVVAVGDQTVMGKLSQVKRTPRASSRQLSHELDRFKYIITLMAIAFGGLVLVLWSAWLNPRYPGFMSPATAVTNATSIIVAFVPEGVSFGLTLTLAVLAKKMLACKMLIKDLSTVESIGSMSVLAADKTGTLTLKELQVSQVILDQVYTKVPRGMAAFHQLATILSLCNSAKQVEEGDATDVACLKFTEACLPRKILHAKYHLEDSIPFRSERRWMAAIYTPLDINPFLAANRILMIKGAPETLLPCCTSRVSGDGTPYPVEKDFQAQVQADVEFHSRQGKRVLVVAYTIINSKQITNPLELPLTYVGMAALIDTPRPEAQGMVAACRTAGIRLVMMTGDHPTTATAIARQIGLVTSVVPDNQSTLNSSHVTISCGEPCQGSTIVMCGEDIETLPPQLWDRVCEYRELVFARTSSTQKLKIVQAFQRRGHCVGVIGDGVNDAPSIRHADVGIAMGSSIEAALQAAKVVLMDNNLALIPQAIENGRRVFVNTNSLLYVVPAGSLSETLPILGNTLLGIPQPLGSLLMTTISVITDLLPSVAVMAEDNRPHLMQQPPRDLQKQPLVRPWPLLRSFLFIGIPDSIMAHLAYFLYMYVAGGIYPSQLLFLFNQWREGYLGKSHTELMNLQYTAQSVFFATLISLQIIKNLLATHTDLRSLPSRLMSFNPNFWYLLTILFTLIVSSLLMYLPLFNTYFNTRPIPLAAWGLAVALAGLGVIIFESQLITQKLNPK